MSVNGIDNNTGINLNYMTGKKRVLGKNFNNQIERRWIKSNKRLLVVSTRVKIQMTLEGFYSKIILEDW